MSVHGEREQTVVVCVHRVTPHRVTPHQMQMVRLEASLAASNSREDHLRGELADTARREGATKERHTRELAEVRKGKAQKEGYG